MIAVGLKNRPETLRDVEVHDAFRHELARNSATIPATMTGVNYNDSRWTAAFRPDNASLRSADSECAGNQQTEMKKMFSHSLIIFRCVRWPRGKFRGGLARRLRYGSIHHSTGDFYHAIFRMHEPRPRFGFSKTGAGKKFAIQTNPRVTPGARCGAIQNMQLVGAIEFRLRFVERDDLAQRVSRIDDSAVFVFDPHVKRSVIGKAVGHERIGANISLHTAFFGHAHGFLPDRSRIGNFENLGLGIEELVEIGKINMGPDMIRSEIMNAKQRCEIDLSGNTFAGRDVKWFARSVRDRRNGSAFVCGNFKTEPRLALCVVQIEISSGEVCDREVRHHRFVGDVLETGKLQLDLDFCERARGDEAKADEQPPQPHESVNYR